MSRFPRPNALRPGLAVLLACLAAPAFAAPPAAQAAPAAAAPAAIAAAAEPLIIQTLEWRGFGLVVRSNRPISPELLVLTRPDRFVVDLPAAEFADPGLERNLSVGANGVKGVRVSKQPDGGVRLVLDCQGPPAFQVMQLGDKSTLVIARAGQHDAALAALVRRVGRPETAVQALTGVWAREGDDKALLGVAGAGAGKPPLRYSLFQPAPDRMTIRVPGGRLAGALPPPGRFIKRTDVRAEGSGFVLDVQLAEGHYEVAEDRAPDGGLTLTWERVEPHAREGKPLVVIDPGHGGADPGAIGPTGKPEKEVCLALGRALRDALRRRGMNAILTRGADAEVYLAPRLAMVERWKADLFVSLHANSHTGPDANGLETYWREPASQPFAEVVHRTVQALLHRPDRGTKQERLYVLRHPRVPSLLLEAGFISNPGEERLLDDPEFQGQAAFAIASGIESYLAEASALARAATTP